MIRVILLVTLAVAASAQTRYPNEIHAHAGAGWTWDDEGSIGSGVSIGGNIARRLTTKLAVEGDFNYFRHKREFSFATWQGSGGFATANLLYHFTRGRVQPYVLGSAGLMLYKPGFGPDTGTATGGAWGFGFGIKGWITERVSIRPEWRVNVGEPDRDGGPEPPFIHSRITVGVGYRW